MTESKRLRDQAARLLALAVKAHERGDSDYANQLTERANHYLDEAAALEASQVPPPTESRPVAQQQQQIQPDKDTEEK